MWQTKQNSLYKKFSFRNFAEALAFVDRVGAVAERLSHHPRIVIDYSVVELTLTTHEKDGGVVTEKDTRLSEAIDDLVPSKLTEKASKIETPALPHEIKLYGDGGSRGNPGPSAGGFVILDLDETVIHSNGKYLGVTTNNQAEYHSLKGGLESALKGGARIVHVYMDSMLVVNQMKGIFKIRNRDLWPIHQAIVELVTYFERVTFTHVPRELNKLADSVVNETLDKQG